MYNPDTGFIFRAGQGDEAEIDAFDVPSGLVLLKKFGDPAKHKVNLVTLEIEDRDKTLEAALWGTIREKRDSLAQLSIDNYHCDQISMARVEYALKHFDELPGNTAGTIEWKRYDGTMTAHTKVGLQAVYDDLYRKIALRGEHLHIRANEIEQEQRTIGELNDMSVWGLNEDGSYSGW